MAEEELTIVIRARDDAARILRALKGDVQGLDRATRAAGDAAASWDAQWRKAGRNMQDVGSDLMGMGRTLTLGVTAPLAAVGGIAVKTFGDFDNALNQSLAIMGDVSEGMREDMSNAAREMALTSTMSAEQAAESIFFLASAGLDAKASIEALPVVTRFAQAGMVDMAVATEYLLDAQNALGLASKDAGENMTNMTRISDVLTKANIMSNASIEEFAAALTNRAAPALRLVGKEVEEGVAVLAAFAAQGVKGEEAGERLSIVLRDLQTAAIKNRNDFAQFGIQVFDSAGEMRNMADIMADLEGALAGMSDETVRATLMQLGFQDRSVQGIMSLIGMSDAIREYEKELKNAGGATQEIADKQLQSFNAQMTLLKHRVQDVMIELGGALVPVLLDVVDASEPMLDAMTRAVEIFSDLPGPVQTGTVIFGGFLATMGPAVFIVGAFINSLGTIIHTMPTLVKSLQTARAAMVAFSMSIPGMAVLTGIVVAIGALTNGFGLMGRAGDVAKLSLDAVNAGLERLSGILGGMSESSGLAFLGRELERLGGVLAGGEASLRAYQAAAGIEGWDGPIKALKMWEGEISATITKMDEMGLTYPEILARLSAEGMAELPVIQDQLAQLRDKHRELTVAAELEEAAFIQSLKNQRAAADTEIPAMVELTASQLQAAQETADYYKGSFGPAVVDALQQFAEEQEIAFEQLLSDLPKVRGDTNDLADVIEERFGKDAAAAFKQLADAAQEAFDETRSAVASLLPTLNETFDEWAARLEQQARLFLNFGGNMQYILQQLQGAHVKNIDIIMAAIEQGGPEVAQAMAFWLAQKGVEGVAEQLGLLDDVANTGMGDMASVIAGDTGVNNAIVSTVGEAATNGVTVARQGGAAAGHAWGAEFRAAMAAEVQMQTDFQRSIRGLAPTGGGGGGGGFNWEAYLQSGAGFANGMGDFFQGSGGGGGGGGGGGSLPNAVEDAIEEQAEEAAVFWADTFAAALQEKENFDKYGKAGGAVANALTQALAEGNQANFNTLAGTATKFLDELEANLSPAQAADIGGRMMAALNDVMAGGGQAAIDRLHMVLSEGNEAIATALAALEEEVRLTGQEMQEQLIGTIGAWENYLKMVEHFGEEGAAVLDAFLRALSEGSEESVEELSEAAWDMMGKLDEVLQPEEAERLGALLMSALAFALADGGADANARLQAVLEMINETLEGALEEATDIVSAFYTELRDIAIAAQMEENFGQLGADLIGNLETAIADNDAGAAQAAAGVAQKIIDAMEEKLPPKKAEELAGALMDALDDVLTDGGARAWENLRVLLMQINELLSEPIELPPVDTEALDESLTAAGVVAAKAAEDLADTVVENFAKIDPHVIEQAVLDAFEIVKGILGMDPLSPDVVASIHEAFAPFVKAVDNLARALGGLGNTVAGALMPHPGYGGAGAVSGNISGGNYTFNFHIYAWDSADVRDNMPLILKEARDELNRNFIGG